MITQKGLSGYGISAEKVQVFETLDSTNKEAKRQALLGAENGTVILANHQREGRGRQGRKETGTRTEAKRGREEGN